MNAHAANEVLAPPGILPSAPRRSMMSVQARTANGEQTPLWCDPLTGLVAYPSFARHLAEQLPRLSPAPVHLAIGDVDDLKEYVSQRRAHDPTCFGHLAGNQCMEALGRVALAWSEDVLGGWPFAVSGTFGGDEVIVAAAGRGYDEFVTGIRDLMSQIAAHVPRTCSFSAGSLIAAEITPDESELAYRHFVSKVDAALFYRKAMLRQANTRPRGYLEDIGRVNLDCADLVARPGGPLAPLQVLTTLSDALTDDVKEIIV